MAIYNYANDIQLEEGLKFANKLSNSHIHFQRLKMKVNIAAQTLRSSVADALQFLLEAGHPDSKNASATIPFIRVIDKLFDLLNSKNLLACGFKKPLKMIDRKIWMSTRQESISYLLKLSDVDGVSLTTHRRKTFVLGFITALTSVRDLSTYLLTKDISPYSFVLTYKLSQDHLELLFACIRGKNGFNNNPDERQFKSALIKILLRVSIISSKQYNCIVFEKDVSPIFSLKWSRKRLPMVEKEDYCVEDEDNEDMCIRLNESSYSQYKDAILGYVGGYIVRKLLRNLSCEGCADALVVKGNKTAMSANYRSLALVKERGGLVFHPSMYLR